MLSPVVTIPQEPQVVQPLSITSSADKTVLNVEPRDEEFVHPNEQNIIEEDFRNSSIVSNSTEYFV